VGEQWFAELQNCELCAWRCGVNRLAGQTGVCGLGLPRVAHATLHPAPPPSYTIFLAGCNFRCLFCQNWSISTYPRQKVHPTEPADPERWARAALEHLGSSHARAMGADRIFFSGGSPTPSFPFVEAVVREARRIDPSTKVNYDTNGFMTEETFSRMIQLADSVTFDIRAISDGVHRTLTGAPVDPVLQNARRMAQYPGKLWEFRVLVVPGFNVAEIPAICSFISQLHPELPVCFLAFRPNFYLEHLRGARRNEMEEAVETARQAGLKNVAWSGTTGLPGRSPAEYSLRNIELPCPRQGMLCGECEAIARCPLRRYRPATST
jgi:pyruvate formate lyase activating enzyme